MGISCCARLLTGLYRTVSSRSRRMSTFKMAFDFLPPSLSPSHSSSYVVPEKFRPNVERVPDFVSIPLIDLKLDQSRLVREISEACQNFGFFQVINHDIDLKLCENMMETATQFFELPPEDKEKYVTKDHKKKVKIFNYYYTDVYGKKINMWSETFTLPWNPMDKEFLNLVPEKPTQYREVYGAYALEMGRLTERVLGLMSLGLGLEEGTLKRCIGEKPEPYSQANYYPPCDKPNLTMGLGAHTDIVALAVLLQTKDASGLQVMKDDQWIYVDPIPNSFVVNVADQIHILSNGRYKSMDHRAVTNNMKTRVSMVMFYAPNGNTVIKPIEELIDEEHRPRYSSFTYRDFMKKFYEQEGQRRTVKEAFEIHYPSK